MTVYCKKVLKTWVYFWNFLFNIFWRLLTTGSWNQGKLTQMGKTAAVFCLRRLVWPHLLRKKSQASLFPCILELLQMPLFLSPETRELAPRLNSISSPFMHWASEQSHVCVKQKLHRWAVSSALDRSFWVLGCQGEPTLLCLFLQLSLAAQMPFACHRLCSSSCNLLLLHSETPLSLSSPALLKIQLHIRSDLRC